MKATACRLLAVEGLSGGTLGGRGIAEACAADELWCCQAAGHAA